MKKLLTAFVATIILATSTPVFAEDAYRSYQRNKNALVSVGNAGKACAPTFMGSILPDVSLDVSDVCSSIPNVYLWKHIVVDEAGNRTETRETRTLDDTYTEAASIDEGGTETLSVTIKSGRSADTNLGASRRLSISDLTNIFGNSETASKLNETMSHGLSAARRSHQEPVTAPNQ